MNRSAYDRFTGEADTPDWHREAFRHGSQTRAAGLDKLSQNPYAPHTWHWKSFNAGWNDEDADLASQESERLAEHPDRT